MRRLAISLVLVLLPAGSRADSTLPQMDFHNPLTGDQLVWMVVILVALYLALSRWGLPRMGAVLEHRAGIIARDLAAAQAAKEQADAAVKALHATLKDARAKAHAEVAEAVAAAKASAAAEAAKANAELEIRLAAAEARIAQARAAALAALRPVAEHAAATMLARLTGAPADQAALAPRLDSALATHAAA